MLFLYFDPTYLGFLFILSPIPWSPHNFSFEYIWLHSEALIEYPEILNFCEIPIVFQTFEFLKTANVFAINKKPQLCCFFVCPTLSWRGKPFRNYYFLASGPSCFWFLCPWGKQNQIPWYGATPASSLALEPAWVGLGSAPRWVSDHGQGQSYPTHLGLAFLSVGCRR